MQFKKFFILKTYLKTKIKFIFNNDKFFVLSKPDIIKLLIKNFKICSLVVEQWTFNPRVLGSIPSMFIYKRKITMNFTLNKFLSRLKNTSLTHKQNLILNFNKAFLPILQLLYREGVILTYTTTKQKLIIKFKYHNNLNNLKKLKFMSTTSKPLNLNKFEISKIYEKNRLLIFSTSQGVLTSLDCKKFKIGGELLFII